MNATRTVSTVLQRKNGAQCFGSFEIQFRFSLNISSRAAIRASSNLYFEPIPGHPLHSTVACVRIREAGIR